MEAFCARPAEATTLRVGAPAGGGEGAAALQERATQLQNASSNPAVRRVFDLIGLPVPATGGRGGFGGALAGGGMANTGDFAVVLQVGGTVMKQRLRVENMGAAGGAPIRSDSPMTKIGTRIAIVGKALLGR